MRKLLNIIKLFHIFFLSCYYVFMISTICFFCIILSLIIIFVIIIIKKERIAQKQFSIFHFPFGSTDSQKKTRKYVFNNFSLKNLFIFFCFFINLALNETIICLFQPPSPLRHSAINIFRICFYVQLFSNNKFNRYFFDFFYQSSNLKKILIADKEINLVFN